MGADLTLESIWKPWFAEYEKRQHKIENATDPAVGSVFDEFRASGAYFRNGYNSGDVMWAMGLSWHGTVRPMLDDRGYLPIPAARELLAMIEARPLTKETLTHHYFSNMTDGRNKHPASRWLSEIDRDEGVLSQAASPDFDHFRMFVTKRRDELIDILKKSIALEEPLEVSL